MRIYYDKLEREYPEILFDPTCLTTYARLLIGCDKAWPSLPELPKAMRRADLTILRNLGVLLDQPAGRYTMLGYAKSRARREARARTGAKGRWGEPHTDAA